MQNAKDRRGFLKSLGMGSALAVVSCRSGRSGVAARLGGGGRFFFVSQGKTALMNADGTGVRYLDFKEPNQVTWQPTGFFSDGRRVLLLSMEARRDGPGRSFEEYYTQTLTHIWIHDLDRNTLVEVVTRERLAPFCTPELLINEERLLVQVVRNKVGQIFNMKLDGTDAREFTRAGEGLPYGSSLSPDGHRVAFHLASPSGYQIWTSDLEGQNRTLIAAHPDYLYFGPRWSPDGTLLVYQACRYREDPGHDWSDVCVSRFDGSEQRVLTQGQPQWFAATYGRPGQRGGGSNMLSWTRDGSILMSLKLPGSKVPWEFQPERPDTDHFNRDYKPELSRGGTEICRLDPRDGRIERLTHGGPGVWDCRASESPDGRRILFCRAETGRMPGVWMMGSGGNRPHLLSAGLEGQGADHPRWLPRAD